MNMNLKLYKKICGMFLLFSLTVLYGNISRLYAEKQKLFTNDAPKKNSTQNEESEKVWNLLERAKREYDAGNLSETVVLANKALDTQQNYYYSIKEKIKKVLRWKSIAAVGDKISDVYNKLYALEQYDTCKLFDCIFAERSMKSLSNSMVQLFAYLDTKAESLPESAYLIGKSFQAQGEFIQAKNYYNRAWEQKEHLHDSDEKLQILYSLAEVSELSGETAHAEKFLLAVLASDPVYGNKNKTTSQLRSMIKNLSTNQDTKKFFLLYRHDGSTVLAAAQRLTEIYYTAGEYEKALEVSAFAVCIITSELEQYAKLKNFLYEYTSLNDLLLQSTGDITVMNWAQERNCWHSYLRFADILYHVHLTAQAEDMYACIASSIPDYAIAQRALYEIQKIHSIPKNE